MYTAVLRSHIWESGRNIFKHFEGEVKEATTQHNVKLFFALLGVVPSNFPILMTQLFISLNTLGPAVSGPPTG